MNNQFITKLLKLYPNYSSVYGPYSYKQGREHIILKGTNIKNKMISYPKAIMEVHLQRRFTIEETVDHIDRNYLNNDLNNLQVLLRSDHVKLDVIRRKEVKSNCLYCNKEIILTRNQLRKDKAGPFCSRSCTGKYGKQVQLDKTKKLSNSSFEVSYYTNKRV